MRNMGISRRSFTARGCCAGLASATVPNRNNATISRRNFVIGGVAALGLGVVGSAGTPAKMLAQAKPHRIDVHHHLSPPPWVDALKKAGLDTPPVTNWTPQRSLDDMDQGGVATSILSAQTPGIGFLGPKEAAAVACASNEYARTLAADHPVSAHSRYCRCPMWTKRLPRSSTPRYAEGGRGGRRWRYGDKFLGDAASRPY
jgi:hypothetical protein